MSRTGNQTGEEGLVGQVGIVLLEVLLGGSGELEGSKLEAAVLETRDDGADKATLAQDRLAGVGIFRVVDGDHGVELSQDRASNATQNSDRQRLRGIERRASCDVPEHRQA